ncbi:MAG: TetR/AcrR family transcriptional regulator [Oscillospiraceae bacterium]|jgi:AcrR family transcriptional regulator
MPKGKALTTRIRIVDCAVALYKSRGYTGVTVHDICTASGLTRSAFYYHFNSKDEILDDYFLSTDIYVTEQLLPALSARSSIEQIYELLQTYLQRTIGAGPALLGQILKRSMDCGVPFCSIRDASVRGLLLSLLGQAQKEGLLRNPTPPDQLLETVFFLSDGVALYWCSKNGKWDVLAEYHQIISSLFLFKVPGRESRPLNEPRTSGSPPASEQPHRLP